MAQNLDHAFDMMISEASPTAGGQRDTITHTRASNVLSLVRLKDLDAARDFLDRLEDPTEYLPHQAPAWIAAYCETLGRSNELVLAALILHGKPAGLLPLERIRSGPVTLLRFHGQNRGNQNTGIWSRPALANISAPELAQRLMELGRTLGIDVVQMARVPENLGNTPLPFALAERVASPSPVYRGKLSNDFDSLFRTAVKKDSRKKLLKKQKALAAAGDYEIVRARTHEEIDLGLDTFVEQRTIRALDTGIPNVFTGPVNRAFLDKLLKPSSPGVEACLEVWWLACGGKIRATFLCARRGGTLYGYSNSIAHDEMAVFSPGIVLLKEIIAAACADPDMTEVDLGLGDERYKWSWTAPVPLFEHMQAVTLKGRVAAHAHRTRQALKGRIRSSQVVWPLVRQLRKIRARKGRTGVFAGS